MIFGKAKENPARDAAPVSSYAVNEEEFEQQVLRASMQYPVIVHFWSPRSELCKALTALLEKAVTQAGGAVLMAKVNIDENPALAQALRIQSIPTVYAFFQGRPVDAFQGAVPEGQVNEFVHKLALLAKHTGPNALDIPAVLKQAAQALADKNFAAAQELYVAALEQDEKNVQAYTGLVRTFIAAGQVDEARALVNEAPDEIAKNPNFSEARTALELAEAKPGGSLADLKAKVEKNPADYQARYDLALAQFAAGEKEEGMDSLIEIIRKKRDWNEEAARKQLLKFFDALGPADPLTLQGRRKLSSVLFS